MELNTHLLTDSPTHTPAYSSTSRSSHVLLVAFLLIAVITANSVVAEVVIQLAPGDAPNVELTGIPPKSLAALSRRQLDRVGWQRIFALYVVSDGTSSATPVLGDYKVVADRLQFTPRFPFKPGLSYRAVFDSAAIAGVLSREKPSPGPSPLAGGSRGVETILTVPAPPPADPTVVEAVFPSSDVLPENLLKFYVHFSAPMQRGDSYRHVRLVTDEGKAVDLPFLELAEELWDETGTRLTLLLDPGRVKQDLKPHKDVGRALAKGDDYVLSVASDWLDAHGNPLAGEFRKSFRVTAPDVQQPDPQRWRLTVPSVGTRQPLIVAFREPLDQAMLQRVIRVANETSIIVDGRITVDKQEMRWSFRPANPWPRGAHQLLIDGTLEDLAGNSIERPFEVFLPAGRPTEIDQYVVPFQIAQ
jgi:hypothetical protein